MSLLVFSRKKEERAAGSGDVSAGWERMIRPAENAAGRSYGAETAGGKIRPGAPMGRKQTAGKQAAGSGRQMMG